MGWEEFELKVLPSGLPWLPTMKATGRRGNRRPRVTLSVPVGLVREVAWWKQGCMVGVRLGDGPDAGKLRVVSGGPYRVVSTTARHEHLTCFVRLDPLPGMIPGDHPRTPVEFEYHNDWIEVELPAWAMGRRAIPAPTDGAVAAPAARAPFVPLIPNQPRGR